MDEVDPGSEALDGANARDRLIVEMALVSLVEELRAISQGIWNAERELSDHLPVYVENYQEYRGRDAGEDLQEAIHNLGQHLAYLLERANSGALGALPTPDEVRQAARAGSVP